MERKQIKIGLMGLGTVGGGVWQLLQMNRESIAAKTGLDFEIAKVAVRDLGRKRAVPAERLTDRPEDLYEDPEIQVIVGVLGRPDEGRHLLAAMNAGKHVVTANKAAVAADYEALREAAERNKVLFRYEASVAGGIPILHAIEQSLQGNEYQELMGILNGTTNYILTHMTEEGADYADVLKKAQELGFAEPDPTADVEGIDAANKLSILLSLVFGARVLPKDIPTEGISRISGADIAAAKEQGCKIKLIARAAKTDKGLEYSVRPTLLPKEHPLAGVNNEFNAVFLKGNAVDELMFYGRGAGALPTASAVWGDLIEVGKEIAKGAAYDLVVAGGPAEA